jgi:hypothetical protein
MKPNPGSNEALDQGCTCPVIDNQNGKGSYKSEGFIINGDCPIHGFRAMDIWEDLH